MALLSNRLYDQDHRVCLLKQLGQQILIEFQSIKNNAPKYQKSTKTHIKDMFKNPFSRDREDNKYNPAYNVGS